MDRTEGELPDGHGPAAFGPPASGPGLPVLPELAAGLAAAAGRGTPEPVGGGRGLLEAACGYWSRRGLATDSFHVLAAAGAQPLLLALLAAAGGDVMVTRPRAPWHTTQPLLLGRPAYPVATPAECGGVPDSFALLETVRRVRQEGGDPRVLVLSVADDPTGTVAPPEVLREACEAAAGQGLLVVSDETYRDTLHPQRDGGAMARTGAPAEPAVVLSPAEMMPEDVVVLADLGASLVPSGWPAAIARFPGTWRGAELHAATLGALAGMRAEPAAPVADAVAFALGEPPALLERVRAAARLHGALAAALHRTVTAHGALCRPPQAGNHVYADLGPLRPRLAVHGITDSVELEEHLTARLGLPVPGGHRFGDAPDELRVRFSTGPLLGADGEQRLAALTAADPLGSPAARAGLRLVAAAFETWTAP